MRLLMLPLVLALPAQLCAQSAEPNAVQEEIVVAELEESAAVEKPGAGVEGAVARRSVAPAASAKASAETAAAQPSMRNFLYQVFLAAVTALVTALIWKAVF